MASYLQELPGAQEHLSRLEARLAANEAEKSQLAGWLARFPGLCVLADAAQSISEVGDVAAAVASGGLAAKGAAQEAKAWPHDKRHTQKATQCGLFCIIFLFNPGK